MDPILHLQDLHLRAGDRLIVRGLHLRVRRGQIAALTDPSGSGKTAVLRAILGQVPVTAGRVQNDGAAIPFKPQTRQTTISHTPSPWASRATHSRQIDLREQP
ncbi:MULTISPECIES: ATP-binding cassette domain-containing protein [unclassified Streptosporangium]|uniref:ATP-binding cassette domain-containing protein n=1 Tax=unclassified Streptosporangium TaxID=2632669 RepID=UPI002E2CEA48|nr:MULTISPECIES: ATP-binding cassette domain-containing protein [unclassified Streptosporangium]